MSGQDPGAESKTPRNQSAPARHATTHSGQNTRNNCSTHSERRAPRALVSSVLGNLGAIGVVILALLSGLSAHRGGFGVF